MFQKSKTGLLESDTAHVQCIRKCGAKSRLILKVHTDTEWRFAADREAHRDPSGAYMESKTIINWSAFSNE